ncbi:MAG: large conductance mechanosensitive channel protein MscL [Breznakia sp.]
MKGFIKDFKEFALKGSIFDMAIGVVIGGAFNKVVSSLVENIILPLISIIFQSEQIATWSIQLTSSVVLPYGMFLQSVVDFLLVALSIFVAVKAIVKFKHKEEAKVEEEVSRAEDIVLLEEIRDLLKKNKRGCNE